MSDDNLGPIVHSNLYIATMLSPFQDCLNVSHWNCRSLKTPGKIYELRDIVGNSALDIFAVSETWLSSEVPDNAVSISGYNLSRNDRIPPKRGGGVAIYTRRGIRHRVVCRIADLHCESLFIEVGNAGRKLLSGVVYLSMGNLQKFEEFHRQFFAEYSNVTVVGDFNCNLFDTTKAISVRSLCMRYNLSIAHNSRPSHFDLSRRSTSLIDFILVRDNSIIRYTNQVQCPSVSDHALIIASLSFTCRVIPEYIEYHDFNQIDWNGLLACLDNYDLDLIYRSTDVDTKSAYVSLLLSALFAFVPKIRRRVRHNGDEWMHSREVVFARSLRDLTYSTFQADRSQENWVIYCRYRNRAKSVIRKARRTYFSRIFRGMEASSMWKIRRDSGCMDYASDSCGFDPDTLNDYFVNSNTDFDVGNLENFLDSEQSFSFMCIGESEIIEALVKVKSRSVGIDGIPVHFIQLIFPHISSVMVDLVNCIIMTSTFPSSWKCARVVPIPKGRVVNCVEDLRPISILVRTILLSIHLKVKP
ncbi:uncharacterized protein LOC142224726 [Haematobia irritans]|uniref:uncharacterized protein LOC142224726 n=1 Tax=Haematobia irritans TaxID=7368 RepID=UPI003F506914